MVTITESLYKYNPSVPLNYVFIALYVIVMAWQGYLTIFKYKSWFFLPVFIGALMEVFGYGVRSNSIKNTEKVMPYALQSAFIILSPLFFGAGNYLIITRLCLRVLPSSIRKIYGIPTRHLTRIFVSSDIICFLVQAGGSGIMTSGSGSGNTAKIGEYALLGGLGVQLATFCFFVGMITKFDLLTRAGCVRDDAGEGWKPILRASYISSTLIIIRSLFRMVEFGMGQDSYISHHEWFFYAFEAVPMLPAIIVFCIWHPAAYFGGGNGKFVEVTDTDDDKDGYRLASSSRDGMMA